MVGEPGFWSPQLSPDGRYVAVGHDRDGTGQWSTTIFDRVHGISLSLPRVGKHNAHAWSPDGQWIYYSAIRQRNGIHRHRADGSGTEETVLEESTAVLLVNSHSPTAPRLLFMDFSNGTGALRDHEVKSFFEVRPQRAEPALLHGSEPLPSRERPELAQASRRPYSRARQKTGSTSRPRVAAKFVKELVGLLRRRIRSLSTG